MVDKPIQTVFFPFDTTFLDKHMSASWCFRLAKNGGFGTSCGPPAVVLRSHFTQNFQDRGLGKRNASMWGVATVAKRKITARREMTMVQISLNSVLFPKLDSLVSSIVKKWPKVVSMVQEKWHLEDWQSFGVSYAKTLRAWKDNLNNWKGLEEFDERFRRMWALRSALELCNVPIERTRERYQLINPAQL